MIGQSVSHYRILEKIGAGGMGLVYRARDERLNRDVALKVLPAGILADEAARKRFRKEALALAKLNHPNIGILYDFDTQDGVDFLVMEYIPGATLAQRLTDGSLPEKEVIMLGLQIAGALEEAHEHSIVHRDLKPGNIMVTPNGQTKVLDFGLARLLDTAGEGDATQTFTQTDAAGTLPYMAPEQLRGGLVDERTDIYAAGAALYEMATGQRPFTEKQSARLMQQILAEAPPPPSAVNRRISPQLEMIILKALDKEPGRRYQSARELRVDLERLTAPIVQVPTRRWHAIPRRWVVATFSAGLVILAVAAWSLFRLQGAQALTESDYILLADFENTTGDPIFDGTLKQGLAVKLGESPFMNVVSDERVRQTLREMQKSPEEKVSGATAREVCQRQNLKAMLGGRISSLGSRYVLFLEAANCQTGDALVRVQVEAQSKEGVLDALGQASSSLRRKLGESLGSIERFNTRLAQATTTSLEALKEYTLGEEKRAREGDPLGRPFYERAIELDPNFAMAYAKLGMVHRNAGEFNKAKEYLKKAHDLPERASERERLYIVGTYHTVVTADINKEIQTYELWIRSYPRDFIPHNRLAALYGQTGQLEKALEEAREGLRLGPENIFSYTMLAGSYIALKRFEEAKAVYEKALEQNFDKITFRYFLYELAFLQGDTAEMESQVELAKGQPDDFVMINAQARAASYYGQLRKYRQLMGQYLEIAQQRRPSPTRPAFVASQRAEIEALVGNTHVAIRWAHAALEGPRSKSWGIILRASLVFALVGDTAQAQSVIDGWTKRNPSPAGVMSFPVVRAAIEIRRRNPAKALEFLRQPDPNVVPGFLDATAAYVRGLAYLQQKSSKEAAAEFQKILDERDSKGNPLRVAQLLPAAQLGLARAYALTGDVANSRKAYESLLTVWKDADADIPALLEAKAEYAKLK